MKNISEFFKKNGFYVAAIVIIAGILAAAGISGYLSGRHERELAENTAEFTEKYQETDMSEVSAAETESVILDEMTGYNADVVQKILSMIEDGTLALEDFEDENSSAVSDNELADQENTAEAVNEIDQTEEAAQMAGTAVQSGYHTDDYMVWPVDGEIIQGYSMDTTVYYPTLEEYKTSPSVLIQSEAGTDVVAVYQGTVLDVYNDPQLGTVVETSLGNGYEAYYGQMNNVNVSVGDTVARGQVLGQVADPTRYYSVEGSHINLKLTKDGEYVDPLDYLE